jgi:hypothetical protein
MTPPASHSEALGGKDGRAGVLPRITPANPSAEAGFSPRNGTPGARRGPRTSREEMDTTICWEPTSDLAALSTANPSEARRWARRGYVVRVLGRYRDGSPRTWETTVPRRAITLRRLVAGALPRRAAANGVGLCRATETVNDRDAG